MWFLSALSFFSSLLYEKDVISDIMVINEQCDCKASLTSVFD